MKTNQIGTVLYLFDYIFECRIIVVKPDYMTMTVVLVPDLTHRRVWSFC